jgi:hypothetical protein
MIKPGCGVLENLETLPNYYDKTKTEAVMMTAFTEI